MGKRCVHPEPATPASSGAADTSATRVNRDLSRMKAFDPRQWGDPPKYEAGPPAKAARQIFPKRYSAFFSSALVVAESLAVVPVAMLATLFSLSTAVVVLACPAHSAAATDTEKPMAAT